MNRIPRVFLAALAGVSAVAFSAIEAQASSLGSRFPALRQEIQDRVDAIPAEGASSMEAKERKKLLAALVHLDVDSPTLDTDLAYAIKALTQLKKANESIFEGTNVLNLSISFRNDVSEIEDNIPYYPRWNHNVNVPRYNEIAQYFIGMGTISGDYLKGCKLYAKALKTLRKRDKAAQKELIPAKKDTLKVWFYSPFDNEEGSKYTGPKTGVQVGAVYDTGDDTLTLHITLVKDGVTRDVTIVVVGPELGDLNSVDATGTLTVTGYECVPNSIGYSFTLSAFDAGTGFVAGSFYFYYDDTDALENCAQVAGIFTLLAMTVQP